MKQLLLIALTAVIFSLGHTARADEATAPPATELPESGPIIKMETPDNFEELTQQCDIETMRINDQTMSNGKGSAQNKLTKAQAKKIAARKVNSPCMKLLDAEKRFENKYQRTRCESQDTYIPTEKQIATCENTKVRDTQKKSSDENVFYELAAHRDECISQIKAEYCRTAKTKVSGEISD